MVQAESLGFRTKEDKPLKFTSVEQVIDTFKRQAELTKGEVWNNIRTIFGITDEKYNPDIMYHRVVINTVESLIIIKGIRETGDRIYPSEDLQTIITEKDRPLFYENIDQLKRGLNRQAALTGGWNYIGKILGFGEKYIGTNEKHRAVISMLEAQLKWARKIHPG